MVENRITTDNGASIVLYTTDDGNTQLDLFSVGQQLFSSNISSRAMS